MWKVINEFLVSVDDFVWGIPLMVLILAGGILMTTRLGLLQMRRLPMALKWMFKNEEEGDGEISSFAALCTALSATIGTGNIVGVATAVCAGGPGALFWMLVAAFFGMATKVRGGTSGGQIPRCGGGRTQPWRTFLLHRKRYGIQLEMAGEDFCIFRCLRRTVWNRYVQSGKRYFQCGAEFL